MARDGRTKDYDPYLLEKIQPQGGITFRDPAMSETGTGYETCLHIYDYPNSLDDYWMAKICNIKNSAIKYRTYFLFIMLDTAFYREKLNENRFVIFIYYECRYAQFALSSR